MRNELVRVKNLTQAYQAQELLTAHNIKAQILPSAKSLEHSGCGYVLFITGNLPLAHTLLKHANIVFLLA